MTRVDPLDLRKVRKNAIDYERRLKNEARRNEQDHKQSRIRRSDLRDRLWGDLIRAAAYGEKSVLVESPSASTLNFYRTLGFSPHMIERRGQRVSKKIDEEMNHAEERYLEHLEKFDNLLDKSLNIGQSDELDYVSISRRLMDPLLVSWVVMHCTDPYVTMFSRYFHRDFSYRGGHTDDELKTIQEIALKAQRREIDDKVKKSLKDLVARIDKILLRYVDKLDQIIEQSDALERLAAERTALRRFVGRQPIAKKDVYEVSLESRRSERFDYEYDVRWIYWLRGTVGQKFLETIERRLKSMAHVGRASDSLEIRQQSGNFFNIGDVEEIKPYSYYCDGGKIFSNGPDPDYFRYIMELLGYTSSLRNTEKHAIVKIGWA